MTSQKETILFVDDEEFILDISREFFTDRGYRVFIANNGKEALAILKKEKVDCCFTDINMPEMGGIELAEHLRVIDSTIPVVVMTGFPSTDNIIQTVKNGVLDILLKPVSLEQMYMCARTVMRDRQIFIDNILLKQEVEKKKQLELLTHELTDKVKELKILTKIMEDFTTVRKSFDVFGRLVDTGLEITHADDVRFYVGNDAVPEPFEISIAGVNGKKMNTSSMVQRRETIKKIVSQVIRAGRKKPFIVAGEKANGLVSRGIHAMMIAPLVIRENVFGVLVAVTGKEKDRFTRKELNYMAFMNNKAAYSIENLALYENIYENLLATLDALVHAIEAKDPYTKEHSRQVTRIAVAIAKKMGCTPEEIETLEVAGPLHDIGKIGIPDKVLLKPSRLSPEEFEIIKKHPEIGSDIVGELGLWEKERQIIRHHHERFDGAGYPDGLSGSEIPKLVRILSAADVFDAMASRRIYREEMDEGDVISSIVKGVGTQFDPEVVDAFVELYKEGGIPLREALK